MRYAEFALQIDVYNLIQCHINVFKYFGGYPQELLYDNITHIVIKRAPKSSDSTWNSHFQDFSEHYSFPGCVVPIDPRPREK
jgi:transposase